MILFRVLMTDALTSKARPAAADQRAARSEFAGVRSVVSLLARRVAKRRDIVLLVPMLVRRFWQEGVLLWVLMLAGAAR